MVIESACHLIKLKLMEIEDCSRMQEEEFSYLIANTCEAVLNSIGVPFPYRIVQVESLYPNSSTKCDFSVDNQAFNLPYNEFHHKAYVECKFFRKNRTGGNDVTRAESLWKDLRKVISSGKGFPYSIVLCEKDYNNVLPTRRGVHHVIINKFFNPNLETIFSFWDNQGLIPTSKHPFLLAQSNINDIEIKVSRTFTEPFPLRFGKSQRLFRIYIFKLFSKNYCCQGFEF